MRTVVLTTAATLGICVIGQKLGRRIAAGMRDYYEQIAFVGQPQ